MDADLDLLLIAVYCTADDFLPQGPENARRRISDAEVITLCIAQAMIGIPSDERFLRAARRQLGHLFPRLPERTAFHKRRLRLSGVIEALIREFAATAPASTTICCWSTPPRWSALAAARPSSAAVPRASSDALANAADYGYCASHSRFFWGFRLHAIFALDGTPRGLALTSPKIDEKLVCLALVARCERQPGQMLILIGDKNFRGKEFEEGPRQASTPRSCAPGAKTSRAAARTSRRSASGSSRSFRPARTSSRSSATAPAPSRTSASRLASRFAALAAGIALNHRLGRPARSLACYTA